MNIAIRNNSNVDIEMTKCPFIGLLITLQCTLMLNRILLIRSNGVQGKVWMKNKTNKTAITYSLPLKLVTKEMFSLYFITDLSD